MMLTDHLRANDNLEPVFAIHLAAGIYEKMYYGIGYKIRGRVPDGYINNSANENEMFENLNYEFIFGW
jgi:hypothetical protein